MNTKELGFAALVVLLLFIVLIILGGTISQLKFEYEIGLPLLAIAGVVALLLTLAVVSISFSLRDLSDRSEALGKH